MLTRGAQRHQNEQVARHERSCSGQQLTRGGAVAALQRMDAEAEQGARVLRVASANLEPDPLRLVPVPGACKATCLLDQLLDLRGHAVSVPEVLRRPKKERRAEARRSCLPRNG